MTTETESLEALRLWLAERLPELQVPCPGAAYAPPPAPCLPCVDGYINRMTENGMRPFGVHHQQCQGRGWVPNVTTDFLLEVLRSRKIHVVFTYDGHVGLVHDHGHYGDDLTQGFDAMFDVFAKGSPNEALCRAAKQALEATP